MRPRVTFSGIKVEIFDLSTLVYIRLHSSSDTSALAYWLVYTRLHSSSDSSTLVYIRVHSTVTRLHPSTLVYTRLVRRLWF